MEREANCTAVGAFVLLIVTMAGLFVYWYAGSSDNRDYRRYEIYFEGSVSGLNRGSTVRYLGVEVGRVVTIRIDKRAADRVQVIADIDSATPISSDTLASELYPFDKLCRLVGFERVWEFDKRWSED